MKGLWTYLVVLLGWGHFLEATSLVWNVPSQNRHFVGRDKILQDTQSLLNVYPLCVLTGGPGFGKSQTVKQFAYLNASAYDVVWWFRADQSLSAPFEKFASALNSVLDPAEQINVGRISLEKLLAEVKNVLRKKPFKCLLIFDNVTDFEALGPLSSKLLASRTPCVGDLTHENYPA